MITFISCCASSYSRKTLANYSYAICAWHLLHGTPWRMNAPEMKATLNGATILASPSSKRPKCCPLTVDVITNIASRMDLSKPLNAPVYACLTTTFFSAAHLSEFTLPSLKAFNPTLHIKHTDINLTQDCHGFKVTVFHLPHTKCSIDREDIYWAAQSGIIDPEAALTNHFIINNPPHDKPLFSWNHPHGLHPLTRTKFLKRINLAASELGINSLKGHSIHIGAILEYLLHGVPFDMAKSIGRWSSEAFLLYLHQHTVIIVPYIQGTPFMEAFTHYTMPPPHYIMESCKSSLSHPFLLHGCLTFTCHVTRLLIHGNHSSFLDLSFHIRILVSYQKAL